ncbi:hypothetical protein FQN54_008735 [Arachnomyces sp. PD_36]|nr:hypothetical protein FQN54_008735 [Arachnomyces sp. PD_36]
MEIHLSIPNYDALSKAMVDFLTQRDLLRDPAPDMLRESDHREGFKVTIRNSLNQLPDPVVQCLRKIKGENG